MVRMRASATEKGAKLTQFRLITLLCEKLTAYFALGGVIVGF